MGSLKNHKATKTILFLMSVQCVMMFQLKEKTLQRRIPQIINPCKSWQPPHVDRTLFTASPPLMSVGRFFFYRFTACYMLWRFHYFLVMSVFFSPGNKLSVTSFICVLDNVRRHSHWQHFASPLCSTVDDATKLSYSALCKCVVMRWQPMGV